MEARGWQNEVWHGELKTDLSTPLSDRHERVRSA
jgi:hypothetical protein